MYACRMLLLLYDHITEVYRMNEEFTLMNKEFIKLVLSNVKIFLSTFWKLLVFFLLWKQDGIHD